MSGVEPEPALGGELDRAVAETVAAAAAAPEPATDVLEEIPIDSPLVGIVMGSRSDLETMQAAARELDDRGISHEIRVISAHREPDTVAEYARTARLRGIRVVIAGAGLSAALPGAIAAHTDLPVIGVPLTSRLTAAGGLDAILSITQMPPGVPVACVGLDNPRNAAVLAARILGAGGPPPKPGQRPTAVG
ncbi:MAG TPA: 5-(carboxyamino)imidazole ribonucleotide mutase [Solirubrobacteraceae bacterium]